MKNRVITISREFGSGGRTIGKQVAEKLRIPCYDNELLTKIAEESGFQENYIKEAGEYAPGGFLSNAFSHRGLPADDAVALSYSFSLIWCGQIFALVDCLQKQVSSWELMTPTACR